MKKMVLVLIVLMAVSIFAGCSMNSPTVEASQNNSPAQSVETTPAQSVETTPTTAKQIKVAYAVMTLGAPYFVEVANGIKSAGEALGWEVTTDDAQMDVAAQIAALETYISQGYDAIFLSSVDSASCATLVKEAVEKGIYVITEATIVEGTSAHVGPDEYDMGYTMGTAVGEYCEANFTGDIKAVTFGTTNHTYTINREKGMVEGLDEIYTKGEVIYIQDQGTIGALTTEDGMDIMEGILQSNPDINVVMGCNDDSIMGAYEAAKAAGADLTQMCFGGVNAIDEALELIKSEKDAGAGAYRVSVDTTPFETGEICVQTLQQIFEGQTFTEKVVVPSKAVTWDNIDSYFTDGTLNTTTED